MQSHVAFCREYVKVVRRPALASTAPGREQYYRWLSGRVKTKPHPDRQIYAPQLDEFVLRALNPAAARRFARDDG